MHQDSRSFNARASFYAFIFSLLIYRWSHYRFSILNPRIPCSSICTLVYPSLFKYPGNRWFFAAFYMKLVHHMGEKYVKKYLYKSPYGEILTRVSFSQYPIVEIS